MSMKRVFRLGGLACIFCSVLLPIPWILEIVFGYPSTTITDTIYFIGLIFLIYALVSVFVFQIEESRIQGFLGFVFTILATCIALGGTWLPDTEELAGTSMALLPTMSIAGLAGYLLLGIGTWRANKFSRWSALLWPLGWTVSLLGGILVMSGLEVAGYLHVIGFLLWGIGFIAAGIRLLSISIEPAMEPESVT